MDRILITDVNCKNIEDMSQTELPNLKYLSQAVNNTDCISNMVCKELNQKHEKVVSILREVEKEIREIGSN